MLFTLALATVVLFGAVAAMLGLVTVAVWIGRERARLVSARQDVLEKAFRSLEDRCAAFEDDVRTWAQARPAQAMPQNIDEEVAPEEERHGRPSPSEYRGFMAKLEQLATAAKSKGN